MGIGPSTKETSLHHFRDPLLEVVSEDTDLDLMGVMLVGSPDGNEDKMLVGTRAAVWASFAAGVGITVSNMFLKYIESPINAGAFAMIAGLIIVPVVSWITPKLKKERVDEIFTCYDEKVTITKKRSLEG